MTIITLIFLFWKWALAAYFIYIGWDILTTIIIPLRQERQQLRSSNKFKKTFIPQNLTYINKK